MSKMDTLNRWLSIASMLAPVVLSQVHGAEKIAPMVPTIAGAILEAEQMRGATGAEKKAHVLAITMAGVNVFNASTRKAQLDPAVIASAASGGIDAVVEAVKAVQKTGILLPPASGAELGTHGGSTGE